MLFAVRLRQRTGFTLLGSLALLTLGAPAAALGQSPPPQEVTTVVLVVERPPTGESKAAAALDERIDAIARNVITRVSSLPLQPDTRRTLVLLAPGGADDAPAVERRIDSLANSNWSPRYGALVEAAREGGVAHIADVMQTARERGGDNPIIYVGPGAFPLPDPPVDAKAIASKGRDAVEQRKGRIEALRSARERFQQAMGDDVWVFMPTAYTSTEWSAYCDRAAKRCVTGRDAAPGDAWVDRAFPAPVVTPPPRPTPPATVDEDEATKEAGKGKTFEPVEPDRRDDSALLGGLVALLAVLLVGLGIVLGLRKRSTGRARLSGRIDIEDAYSPVGTPTVFERVSLSSARSYEISSLPCEGGSLVRLKVLSAEGSAVRVFAFYQGEGTGQETQRLVADKLTGGTTVAQDGLRFRYVSGDSSA